MGQPAGSPTRPKTGQITVFDPFIDGGPVRPDPFLTDHKRIEPKQTKLTCFDTLILNELL